METGIFIVKLGTSVLQRSCSYTVFQVVTTHTATDSRLADDFHVIVPDDLGFAHSDVPNAVNFSHYSAENRLEDERH